MPAKKSEVSFEENIKKLEDIVRTLESGESSLDEMLSLFGEGIDITKECTNQLEKAEQKITVMMKKVNGEMQEEPFEQN